MARVSTLELILIRNSLFSCSISTPAPRHYSSSRHLLSSSSSRLRFPGPSAGRKTSSAYRSVVSLFEKCKRIRQLFQIQAHLIVSGLFLNPYMAARLLKFSADYGDIDYTVLIFQQIESPHIFCVNTLIKAYSVSSFPEQAVLFYFQRLKSGFIPNSFTFPPLIISTAKSGSIEHGRNCHGQAIKRGVSFLTPVLNSLISMYGSLGDNGTARNMFDEMTKRDIVTWNSMMGVYAKCGQLSDAHKLFSSMPERNVVSWNIMITGEMEAGNTGRVMRLFRDMMVTGMRGSGTTMVSMITVCGRSFKLKEGRSVHGSVWRVLLQPSLILDTALIDMYSRCERVDIAEKVFNRMSKKNLVSWNAMILGHCLHGKVEDGLGLFDEMVNPMTSVGELQRIIPDEITFIGVLCGCARAGLLTEGRNYLKKMISSFGVKPNFGHYWCIANLLSGLGLAHEAEKALKSSMLDDRDGSSQSSLWANVLGASRFLGNTTLGEEVAKVLLKVEPHNFMFNALLLNIYAVSGRWEDVEVMKKIMKAKGFETLPGCSLWDLKELVHNLRVCDHLQPEYAVESMKKEIGD